MWSGQAKNKEDRIQAANFEVMIMEANGSELGSWSYIQLDWVLGYLWSFPPPK
jgi:hypothetical protein